MSRLLAASLVLVMASTLCAVATAQVTDLQITSTAGTLSSGESVVANAFSIDFVGQYTGSQFLVELTRGEIINIDFFGGPSNTAPSSGAVAEFPDLAFDTFVAQGALRSDAPNAAGTLSLGGSAVNIDPETIGAVFNDPFEISQAWYPPGGVFIEDRVDFVVGQVTFTEDATGTISYFASANSQFFFTHENNDPQALPLLSVDQGRVVGFLPADYDGDGQVAQGDLDLILANWGRDVDATGAPAGWVFDLPTGLVDQNEYDALLFNWGATAAPVVRGLTVPEPATAWLIVVGLLVSHRRRFDLPPYRTRSRARAELRRRGRG